MCIIFLELHLHTLSSSSFFAPPSQVGVCIAIYEQDKDKDLENTMHQEDNDDDDDDEASPLQVGHNIYILAYKLAEHKRDLKEALRQASNNEAIKYYTKQTAQIEVSTGVSMLRVY